MATITTTKKINALELHKLLGGDMSDLSTNGVPLDADGEKEVTATVKGDGETPITQAELSSLIDQAETATQSEATTDTNWKTVLQQFIDKADTDLAAWPADLSGTPTTTQMMNRINAIADREKRNTRALRRLAMFIRDNVRDTDV